MMKTKRFFWLMLILVASLAVAGCSDDDDDPGDPNNAVADPEGTVTLNVRNRNNGYTDLSWSGGTIAIDEGNNFEDKYWSQYETIFVSLGEMKGLGNIIEIPEKGWVSKIAVKPGYGYVAQDWDLYDNSPSFYSIYKAIYCRMYVTKEILTTGDLIIGYEVKYQEPMEWKTKLEIEFEGTTDRGMSFYVKTDAKKWEVTDSYLINYQIEGIKYIV